MKIILSSRDYLNFKNKSYLMPSYLMPSHDRADGFRIMCGRENMPHILWKRLKKLEIARRYVEAFNGPVEMTIEKKI